MAGANILTTSTALLASTALDAPVRKLALLNTGFKILGVQVALRSAVAVSHHGQIPGRWGFPPQGNEEGLRAVASGGQKLAREGYPAVAAHAKADGAEIHWGDESGLRSDDVRECGFAPKGQTPVIRVNNKLNRPALPAHLLTFGRLTK